MTARPAAGFRYQQRLGVGFFGEIYRALGGDGQEVRITHVDADFAGQPGFAAALAKHGALLGRLAQRNVLATRLVGRIPSGVFVVVTDAVAGSVTLAEVLNDAAAAGRKVPAPVAWAIGRGVVAALAHAHAAGVIHGGVHPRSVLLDAHGTVKLADFGVARALAAVAAQLDQPRLYQGYRGYLAPELALGEEPGSRADVYAAGALLHVLLGGEPPPALFAAPREVLAVLRRAVATDVEGRYRDANELAAALAQVTPGEASGEQVAAWVADLPGAVDAGLDAETEDVLSSIANETFPREEVTAPIEIGDAALDAATADLLAELDAVAPPPTAAPPALAYAPPAPPAAPATDPGLARALSALEHEVAGDDDRARTDPTGLDGPTGVRPTPSPSQRTDRASTLEVEDDQVTHVDDSLAAMDPLADLVATVTSGTGQMPALPTLPALPLPRLNQRRSSNDDTPLPRPTAHHEVEGTITRAGQDMVAASAQKAKAQAAAAPPRVNLDHAAAYDAINAETVPTPPVEAPRRRMRLPSLSAADLGQPAPAGGSRLWLVTTIVTVIALIAFLNFKTDLFHPARARAREEAENQRYEAERRKAEAAIPKSGTVSIDSNPGEAAVWLLLGRTPIDTIPLQSGAVHQIRLEHEGFAPRDLEVTSSQWSGAAGGLRASVAATLDPLRPGAKPTPAFPPPPVGQPVAESARGVLHLESTPPGAQAWLLVGYTPGVDLAGVLAGAGYEFKVTKDGFAPGFVVIRPGQWQDTEGKLLTSVSGSAELVAVAPPPRGRP